MLSSEEFHQWAKNDVIPFLHVTGRFDGEPNPGLLQEKGGRGFPYLVFMNAEGDVVTQQGDRTLEGFKRTQGFLSDWMTLSKKDQLTTDEKGRLLVAKAGLGKIEFEDAKTEAGTLEGLSEDIQAAVDQALVNMEVQSLLPTSRVPPEEIFKIGGKFADMAAAGRTPDGGQAALMFWFYQMAYAENAVKVDVFETAMEHLKELYEGNEQFWNQQKQRLEALKEKAAGGDEEDGEGEEGGMGGGR